MSRLMTLTWTDSETDWRQPTPGVWPSHCWRRSFTLHDCMSR